MIYEVTTIPRKTGGTNISNKTQSSIIKKMYSCAFHIKKRGEVRINVAINGVRVKIVAEEKQ